MFYDYCVVDDDGSILYVGDSWDDAHDWMVNNCDGECQIICG